jgi:hypothetical protein
VFRVTGAVPRSLLEQAIDGALRLP